MIQEGSTKIVDFMTLGAGVLVLIKACPFKSYRENTLSSTLLIYSTLMAIIILRDYGADFLCHC